MNSSTADPVGSGASPGPGSYKEAFLSNKINDMGPYESWNKKGGVLLGPPSKHINVRSDGEEVISFSKTELEALSIPYKLALVGKFSHGYPSMVALRKAFNKLNLKGEFSLGLLNQKHVLIKLKNEDDYTSLWEKGIWWLEGYPMRILKWTPHFDPAVEPAVAPVWIKLNYLPVCLFTKQTLTDIAQTAGKPLKIDEATLSLARPHCARICIEMDLLSQPKEHIFIELGDKTWKQIIEYERIPYYCTFCKKIGHQKNKCNIKLRREEEIEKRKRDETEKNVFLAASNENKLPEGKSLLLADNDTEVEETDPVDVNMGSKKVVEDSSTARFRARVEAHTKDIRGGGSKSSGKRKNRKNKKWKQKIQFDINQDLDDPLISEESSTEMNNRQLILREYVPDVETDDETDHTNDDQGLLVGSSKILLLKNHNSHSDNEGQDSKSKN